MDELLVKNGLYASILRPGTRLMVETLNSFYEIKIIDHRIVEVFGGTRRDGTTRFPQPVEGIVIGSTWGGSMLKVDWVGLDMRLELRIVGTRGSLVTSPVKKIVVEAPDGGWAYTID
jgi:hypothetical protein